MIRRYRFGTPIETHAAIKAVPEESGSLPFFELQDGAFIRKLSDCDIIYGLGQQVRGINKRGWKYRSLCSDNCNHQEDTQSLYGAHNFMIISGETLFGVFFDYSGSVSFDAGFERRDVLKVVPEDMNLDVYIITGDTEKAITKEFRQLIGRSYIAPLWAFGYGQSRWGYRSAEEIRTVAAEYRKRGIPIDSIYLDIDYMERYKDFTVNAETFPDFEAFVREMRAEGIHPVPIIDAGVKIEEGYDLYEEGVRNNFFCKDEEGNDFTAAVWPGRVHFPDFLNEDARKWFGSKYSFLLEKGIDGFWNDMNEPAIFYTEKRLRDTIARVNEISQQNMGIDEYFEFTGIVAGIGNNEGDYDAFFHNIDGERTVHRRVHNLYGFNMTRAASEYIREAEPDRRILLFSRASYIGAHRYGGIWQGDNKSWWSHLLMNLQMMPSLNMAGFIFTGADTGGFNADVTEDLMIRWMQLSLFTPLLRNHSAMGTRQQELYRFNSCETLRKMVEVRYSLIPYIYSEYMKAALGDEMMFRPLAFDFREDEDAASTEDQVLLGDELMLAPVYTQNARGRHVYLPEDMILIRMRAYDDYDVIPMTQGHHYIKAELSELIFFIRKGKAIPMVKPAENTAALDTSDVSLLGWENAEYQLYTDNGISTKVSLDGNVRILRK